jgi:hypothetical protein
MHPELGFPLGRSRRIDQDVALSIRAATTHLVDLANRMERLYIWLGAGGSKQEEPAAEGQE